MAIRPNHVAAPFPIVFSGKQTSRQALPNALAQKLQGFQQGLQEITAWDRRFHPTPVIQSMNTDRMVAQAKTFLLRQQSAGTHPAPVIIGIAGGTASGKTFVKELMRRLFRKEAPKQVSWEQRKGQVADDLELDSYYKDKAKRIARIGMAKYLETTNLDIPQALTMHQAYQDIMKIKNGTSVWTPRLDYVNGKRMNHDSQKFPTPFFLVEGLFTLWSAPIRKLCDFKVFVDTDRETITQRWWKRAPERGIKNDISGQTMFQRGMAMHDIYVAPSKAHADVVLNGAAPKGAMASTVRKLTQLLLKTFYPQPG